MNTISCLTAYMVKFFLNISRKNIINQEAASFLLEIPHQL